MDGVVGQAVVEIPQWPLLLVGSLAVLAALVAGGGWALERYLAAPVDRLCEVLADREEVVVLLHPNPDPDAMACGMAVAHLAESVGTAATIQHAGEIRHPENRVFASVFDLDLRQIEDTQGLVCRDAVLVDHSDPRGFAGAGGLTPLAVLDHHPGGSDGEAFTDVRPEYGACSTMLAEYVRDREGRVPTPLATALIRGVQSDTKSLTRGCSTAEFEAAEFLYDDVDPVLLDRVATPELPPEFLDARAAAIDNRRERDSFVVSDVGRVTDVTAIASAADELCRLAGARAAVVFGTCDDTLHVSGRSRDPDVHVGKALERALAGIPMSDAGGHARMGGGQISIPHLNGIGPSGGVGREGLYRRLFNALNRDARLNPADA